VLVGAGEESLKVGLKVGREKLLYTLSKLLMKLLETMERI